MCDVCFCMWETLHIPAEWGHIREWMPPDLIPLYTGPPISIPLNKNWLYITNAKIVEYWKSLLLFQFISDLLWWIKTCGQHFSFLVSYSWFIFISTPMSNLSLHLFFLHPASQRGLLTCWPNCMYSVYESTALLCPSSLPWLSCRESFL